MKAEQFFDLERMIRYMRELERRVTRLEEESDTIKLLRECEFPGCSTLFKPKQYGVDCYLCPEHSRPQA